MYRINSYLKEKGTWEFLRLVGEVKILKLTLISPFLPFLFLILNKISLLNEKVPILNSFNLGWPSVHFWQVTIFYYGLMSLGFASLLYYIFCPHQIKQHRNYFSYIKSENPTMTVTMKRLTMMDINKNYKEKISEAEKETLSSTPGNIDNYDLLQIYFSLLSSSKENIRVFVSTFYLLGFILVFTPSIFKFIRVTWILIKSLFN